jgi:hypothetical protein
MADYPKPTDIGTVLRRIRAGDRAKLDKRKALADLGYGSEKNVDKEVAAADDYRKLNNLPPLNMKGRDSSVWVKPTDNPKGPSWFKYWLNDLDKQGFIENRTKQSTAKPSMKYGTLGGEVITPVEVLGHELTHSMTRSEAHLNKSLGASKPQKGDADYVPVQGDRRKLTNEQLNDERAVYPESHPREFAPPLAAMTRLEYQLTGKRVDTPEKFDKKVAEYGDMSSKEKLAFKKDLPLQAARFYNYLDTVSDPEAKDLMLWGTEGDKKTPVRLEGKDRRKRFLDISREMIPSLVEKEDSFEEAVNRKMS